MISNRHEEGFIPEHIHDKRHERQYTKGRFMGKGGFARCYEIIDVSTSAMFAGKIVSKTLLTKSHQQQKMRQEIEIHKALKHAHVVRFYSYFEDDHNVYVVLEICQRRTLMELQRRRKIITEPEARYFMYQTIDAIQYLHRRKIIHRDLKLGNLFLNNEMKIKVGDFGLATMLQSDDERKRTLCGTPNYIAPEVLLKNGHGYAVDIWALGCILFTLLVGHPPFETSSLKDTYSKIRHNDYFIPPGSMSQYASLLIRQMLDPDPDKRPTINQVMNSCFIVDGFKPSSLPFSCCTTAPRFDDSRYISRQKRKPLLERNVERKRSRDSAAIPDTAKENVMGIECKPAEPEDPFLIIKLEGLVREVLEHYGGCRLDDNEPNAEEWEDPSLIPFIWVSRWVDYSDRYGLGYQLCDDSIGIVFNDNTRMLQASQDCEDIQYIDQNGCECFYKLTEYPEELFKKVTLLSYFKEYMDEHLTKTGEKMALKKTDALERLPFIRSWFRTRNAIVLQLSNGTLQMNFFRDHTKLILCPVMEAVTTILANQQFRTHRFDQLTGSGISRKLFNNLQYSHVMIRRIMETNASGRLRSTS
ncbi:hypothetical protein GJ496_002067 [Pomphorhynchus laevis]|nr:hypothetical protein GJ496_002067 [Pomphorhynchus laevis]